MTSVPKTLRRIVAAVLLFIGLTFQHITRTDTSGVETEIRLGAWFSPWLIRTDKTQTTTTTTPDGGSVQTQTSYTKTDVTTASWSWPILAAGLALLLWPSKKTP